MDHPIPSTPGAPGPRRPDAATSLLTPENFATRFAGGNLRDKRVMKLQSLLAALKPEMPAAAFAEWLEDLAHWLHHRGAVPGMKPGEAAATARVRMLTEALEYLPDQHAWLRRGVARLFAESRGVMLFTDVGLPSRQGFVAEFFDRLSRALLPEAPVEDDLGQMVPRLFPSERAVRWFERLPEEVLAQLVHLLSVPSGAELEPLKLDMRDAALILANRISHHGLANDVRSRSPRATLVSSPFYRLPQVVQALVAAQGVKPGEAKPEAKPGVSPAEQAREAIAACRKVVREVHAGLEHTGVSVDLVYRLDLIRRQLDRLYSLVGLLAPHGGKAVEGAGLKLLTSLVRGGLRDRSLTELFRSSTRLLSRRVVEAAAHSGEHYVTRTKKEFSELLDSAGGGGLITAFTALFKFVFAWAGMAPFWEGFFFSLNYAGSFVAMQLMGFSLASKQPAMTAATLARSLKESQSGGVQMEPLAKEVARTVRSQLAATLGNLGIVVPTAVIVDLVIRLFTGQHLLNAAYAAKVVAAHHPLKTGVVLGAMVTGVALWLSSVVAGTVENWAVYRHLPQALARWRLIRAMAGPKRAQRFSDWVMEHLSGFGGNIALGVQMGLIPTFAEFFGIPLTLPHVAVATGQLAFAGAALGPPGVMHADFAWAAVGIFLVGTMNFGVSFVLALWVALRAREVGTLGLLDLWRAVWKLLKSRPADFFRPPKDDEPAPPAPEEKSATPLPG